MRRIVALATLIALAATLLVPVAALAKGGPPAGKGPGFTPPGQAKKVAAPAEEPVVAAEAVGPEGDAPEPDGTQARKAEKAAEKAEKKSEKAAAKAEKKAEKAEWKAVHKPAGTVAASLEESETPEPEDVGEPAGPAKLTGIANALSRIMANIERAEARVEAGQKSHVPQGLLNVLAKFLGWLGIDAEPEIDADDPALDDPGLTDPGNGSDEETSTPLPDDGSEEDTVTVEPELEE
ncbi:MAG: hypothetical protein ACNA76_03925 [Anaerosomatales bacterium]